MKILFATNNTYLPQNIGGSELSTHDLCVKLGAMGVNVGVLCALDKRGVLGFRNRLIRKIAGNQFPHDRVMGYPVYRGWDPTIYTEQVIKKFKPSLVVVQAIAPMKLARVLVDLSVKTVVYLRDVQFDLLGGEVFSHPNLKFIANSNFTSSKFNKMFGITAEPIPPLVDYGKYCTESSRSRVVFVCPYPQKGVEIAFQLAEARPDIPFDFVESWELGGDWLQEITRRAEKLGNVRIVRRVLDMRSIYSQAKVLLVPSICEEAWGRVVSEAHVSGIPVLASNIGGLPESTGSGGILVSPNAPISEWIEAISTIWDDLSCYNDLSEKALLCSRRPEIQSENIINKLVLEFKQHTNNV